MRFLDRWRTNRTEHRVADPPEVDAPITTVSFRDPAVAERLARDGFARLGPCLTDHEVAEAAAIFAEAHERLGGPLGDTWYPTILWPDDEVRAFVTERLGALVEPKLDAVLDPATFEVVRLDYSVKPPSEASELGPHQDYALVDERTAQSLYLWIPLCDTDEVNGTLHVVPGSHRFSNRIRSRHVPSYFDEVIDEVHAASTRLDCVAGELVIMVSGVIHHSPPNRSGELRLAAHGIVRPAGVPLVFYYEDEDTPAGQVECYELDIDRYVRAIHGGRPPDVAVARLEERPVSSMTPARLADGLAAYGASKGS